MAAGIYYTIPLFTSIATFFTACESSLLLGLFRDSHPDLLKFVTLSGGPNPNALSAGMFE